jgi:hypothetical protein
MKKLLIGLAVVAFVVSLIPSVFANCVCVCEYTPGYWKHNVRVYVEGRGSYAADYSGVKESDDSMECYEAWLRANVGDFSLEWANDEFWMRGPGRQPVRQMIADLLNEAKANAECVFGD